MRGRLTLRIGRLYHRATCLHELTGPAAIVLAAGQGTRMRSRIPKVLHPLAGRPMIHHVLDALGERGHRPRPVVVTGHGADAVEAAIADRADTARQEPAARHGRCRPGRFDRPSTPRRPRSSSPWATSRSSRLTLYRRLAGRARRGRATRPSRSSQRTCLDARAGTAAIVRGADGGAHGHRRGGRRRRGHPAHRRDQRRHVRLRRRLAARGARARRPIGLGRAVPDRPRGAGRRRRPHGRRRHSR